MRLLDANHYSLCGGQLDEDVVDDVLGEFFDQVLRGALDDVFCDLKNGNVIESMVDIVCNARFVDIGEHLDVHDELLAKLLFGG